MAETLRVVGWFQKLFDDIAFFLLLTFFGIFFVYVLVRRTFYKSNFVAAKPKIRKMMCFVLATMASLKQKGVESHILQRDLNGYWDSVYTVHPSCESDGVFSLNARHTVLEFSSYPSRFLRRMGARKTNGWYSLLTLLKQTHKVIKKERISVLKAHDPYAMGVIALILSTLCKVPYVVMICSSYDLVYKVTGRVGTPVLKSRLIDKVLGRITFGNAAMVFGGSEDAGKFGIRNGASPGKTFIVRTGGVDEEHFQPLQNRRDLKGEFGLDGRKFITYIGRLIEEKFPRDCIMAFAEVNKVRQDCVLLLIGDGVLREELQSLVLTLKLAGKVRFLGFQPQETVMNLMFTSDVIVAPLSGSALVEACLSSTPVVAYDVDWHSELIKDGETGLLVPYRDYKAMARAVIEVLNNAELAKRLGGDARKFALTQHHLDVTTCAERECYEKLLSDQLL